MSFNVCVEQKLAELLDLVGGYVDRVVSGEAPADSAVGKPLGATCAVCGDGTLTVPSRYTMLTSLTVHHPLSGSCTATSRIRGFWSDVLMMCMVMMQVANLRRRWRPSRASGPSSSTPSSEATSM
jgi:hypothetical protein